MRDFHGRLDRIEQIHDAGGGFEATGTLGQSYYTRHRRRRLRLGRFALLVLILASFVLVKAGMLVRLGPETYAERVSRMQAGDALDRVGAYVLQADPLTQRIAELLRDFAG